MTKMHAYMIRLRRRPDFKVIAAIAIMEASTPDRDTDES